MDYLNVDQAERANRLARNTGLGDLSGLTDADAQAAEIEATALELRAAFFAAHGGSADPEAAQFAKHATALAPAVASSRELADRIATATGAVTAATRADVLTANRAKAEGDCFDAEWRLANDPDLTDEARAALQVVCDRAEREAAVIDGL